MKSTNGFYLAKMFEKSVNKLRRCTGWPFKKTKYTIGAFPSVGTIDIYGNRPQMAIVGGPAPV